MNCPTLARKNPNSLVQLVKIIQSGDEFCISKNKPIKFKPAAIAAINSGIDARFEEKLAGCTDVIQILDKTT